MRRLLLAGLALLALGVPMSEAQRAVSTIYNLAAPPPIGSTTPNSGAFTTISASSTITPSQTNGIVGTTTNNSANAGSVGEYISSTVLQVGQVALSNGSAATVTTVALSGGDWDCHGNIVFNPAGGTTIGAVEAVINTSSALPTSPGAGGEQLVNGTLATGGVQILQTGTIRESTTGASTTIFLVAQSAFGTAAMNAFGFLGCRRAR